MFFKNKEKSPKRTSTTEKKQRKWEDLKIGSQKSNFDRKKIPNNNIFIFYYFNIFFKYLKLFLYKINTIEIIEINLKN